MPPASLYSSGHVAFVWLMKVSGTLKAQEARGGHYQAPTAAASLKYLLFHKRQKGQCNWESEFGHAK